MLYVCCVLRIAEEEIKREDMKRRIAEMQQKRMEKKMMQEPVYAAVNKPQEQARQPPPSTVASTAHVISTKQEGVIKLLLLHYVVFCYINCSRENSSRCEDSYFLIVLIYDEAVIFCSFIRYKVSFYLFPVCSFFSDVIRTPFKVLYNFEARNPDELGINEGETVMVVEHEIKFIYIDIMIGNLLLLDFVNSR